MGRGGVLSELEREGERKEHWRRREEGKGRGRSTERGCRCGRNRRDVKERIGGVEKMGIGGHGPGTSKGVNEVER